MDGGEGQRGRDDARTLRHAVKTGWTAVSDGVDSAVGEDGGVALSDTRAAAREVRQAAGLSGRGHGRRRGQDGSV
jgi:hypothetical protein